jgi:hypothetical protein
LLAVDGVTAHTIASNANENGRSAGNVARRERYGSQRHERTLEGIGSFSWKVVVIAGGW